MHWVLAMMLPSYTKKDEPFEVRKIAYRHRFSATENHYDVEIYYPEKLHSVCWQMIGQDEAEIYARLIAGRPNNVRCAED